jgi:hypothetical protein
MKKISILCLGVIFAMFSSNGLLGYPWSSPADPVSPSREEVLLDEDDSVTIEQDEEKDDAIADDLPMVEQVEDEAEEQGEDELEGLEQDEEEDDVASDDLPAVEQVDDEVEEDEVEDEVEESDDQTENLDDMETETENPDLPSEMGAESEVSDIDSSEVDYELPEGGELDFE